MVDFNPFGGPDLFKNLIKASDLPPKNQHAQAQMQISCWGSMDPPPKIAHRSIQCLGQKGLTHISTGEILLWIRLHSFTSFSQPVQLFSDSLWMLLSLQGARPVRSWELQTGSVIYTETEQGESGDRCIKERMRTRCLRSGKRGKRQLPKGTTLWLPCNQGAQRTR